MRQLNFSYETLIRINLDNVDSILSTLKSAYEAVPGGRSTTAGRSAFSRWNNLRTFIERCNNPLSGFQFVDIPSTKYPNSVVVRVIGSSKGSSSRVYHVPSVTSLTKEVRKLIVPVYDDHEFVFFDLKAAEFALMAYYAGEKEALSHYHNGEDIYGYYSSLFPPETPRKVYKTILIASLYGTTGYRVSQQLGISETAADRLLSIIDSKVPRLSRIKQVNISRAQSSNVYWAPNGFNQDELIEVAKVDPVKGFNPNMALSAYGQSGLGFLAQDFTTRIRPLIKGTILSVFDSFLAEMAPDSVDRYKKWVTEVWQPLLPGDITEGSTFYEAAYGI